MVPFFVQMLLRTVRCHMMFAGSSLVAMVAALAGTGVWRRRVYDMDGAQRGHQGFTLVELMVVVLIIGILVSIAVPVYVDARRVAEVNACQANQRTILSAIAIARAADIDFTTATAGELAPGISGWYDLMVPEWIEHKPSCPVGKDNYYVSAAGEILGDQGPIQSFKAGHQIQ